MVVDGKLTKEMIIEKLSGNKPNSYQIYFELVRENDIQIHKAMESGLDVSDYITTDEIHSIYFQLNSEFGH